jgi:hypothetical protein
MSEYDPTALRTRLTSCACTTCWPTGPKSWTAHWPPKQALAVFECLQILREALWQLYGPQVQQA